METVNRDREVDLKNGNREVDIYDIIFCYLKHEMCKDREELMMLLNGRENGNEGTVV